MATQATIVKYMPSTGNSAHYDENFRRVLEDYLPQLQAEATVQPVENFLAYKYEGAFFDYLYAMKVPLIQHWIIMRLNGMTHPTQFDGRIKELLMPNMATVDTIASNYKTQYKIRK